MKTSQQWWDSIKDSPNLINNWLLNQFYGEMSAYLRITSVLNSNVQLSTKQQKALEKICQEELTHAHWIRDLLTTRNLVADSTKEHVERYWQNTLPSLEDKTSDELFAIGAHAEEMRLERIKVIANDLNADKDIKETFVKILKDELTHAALFKNLTTEDEYNKAKVNHDNGLNALGLVI